MINVRKAGKWRRNKFVLITSIRSMLMLTVLIILLSSIGIWYLIQNYLAKANNEMYSVQKDSADIYISGISDKLTNYVTAMGVVSMSNDLRDNIFMKDVSRSEMVILSKELGQKISEMTFFLYQSQEVIGQRIYSYLPADGYYFWDVESVKDNSWFMELGRSLPQWWYDYSDVTHSYHLTLAGIINNYNRTFDVPVEGYCCQTITVDTNTLFKPYKGAYENVYIFDNSNGEIIYTYSEYNKTEEYLTIQKIQDLYNDANDNSEQFQKIRLTDAEGNSATYSALTRNISTINATAIIMFNPNQKEWSYGLWIIVFMILFLIIMMTMLIISNRIYNRKLNTLIKTMDGFDENDIQPVHPIGGKDELARIERHLYRMQQRIQNLIQKEYTAKIQLMTAREQALMSCINPHFLYNTLNTISAMACIEGADNTTEMVVALSAMFRYSSEVTKPTVTLREELSNISDYLYIQSIRHQNAFSFDVEIEEELYSCQVPKLILQPLIENAFKHGFKNNMADDGKDKKIWIRGVRKDNDLIISIKDNGDGIVADRLSIIQKGIAEPVNQITVIGNKNSVGLLNVHQRIRLQYKESYGLVINSKGRGSGACVYLHMPCQKK